MRICSDFCSVRANCGDISETQWWYLLRLNAGATNTPYHFPCADGAFLLSSGVEERKNPSVSSPTLSVSSVESGRSVKYPPLSRSTNEYLCGETLKIVDASLSTWACFFNVPQTLYDCCCCSRYCKSKTKKRDDVYSLLHVPAHTFGNSSKLFLKKQMNVCYKCSNFTYLCGVCENVGYVQLMMYGYLWTARRSARSRSMFGRSQMCQSNEKFYCAPTDDSTSPSVLLCCWSSSFFNRLLVKYG